ncbi:hypothetical protein HZB01_04670 [Candidatus Woesearchaeota archaeon]|nr:hypothetical protein [Candidatus Woesearchaeota archaeon]
MAQKNPMITESAYKQRRFTALLIAGLVVVCALVIFNEVEIQVLRSTIIVNGQVGDFSEGSGNALPDQETIQSGKNPRDLPQMVGGC